MTSSTHSKGKQTPKPFSWIYAVLTAIFLYGLSALGTVIVERVTPAEPPQEGTSTWKHEWLCFWISLGVHIVLQVAGIAVVVGIVIFPKLERSRKHVDEGPFGKAKGD